MAEGVSHALVFELGAGAAALGARLVWPEETPETTAELVEKLDRATRPAGLDQCLDVRRPGRGWT